MLDNILQKKANDFRIFFCLRKSKVSVEDISVCQVIENWWSMADTPTPMAS